MDKFSTHEVASKAGIHRDTLLRWLREKKIPEPARDRNGWRIFSEQELDNIIRYAQSAHEFISQDANLQVDALHYKSLQYLQNINWDFDEDRTNYSIHGLHPYPAKFIPQIPKTLIRELASSGETILDPFCGSGTTLVEALKLDCNAIGLDANPLACQISAAKTTHITDAEAEMLMKFASTCAEYGASFKDTLLKQTTPIAQFDDTPFRFDGVEDWFDDFVIQELAFIKSQCNKLPSNKLVCFALTIFSSIIVTVSRQDSDTRYVRRKKKIVEGEVLSLFGRSLSKAVPKALEFSSEIDPKLSVKIFNCNILSPPQMDKIDLMVCSPPYPNAYSYHLYHRTRLLWLGMDQVKFKGEEIGSHRKYSSKSIAAPTIETFKNELKTILIWLTKVIKVNRHACFVLGDSTIRGQVYKNDQILIDIAEQVGFKLEANITRVIKSSKKSFNPSIGKIKDEHIIILRNQHEE